MTTVAPPASTSTVHPKITILKRARADIPLAQNKFLKKTAKGKVLSFLRERYVRDDIPCGYEQCHLCSDFPGYKPVLPRTGYAAHARFSGREGHWQLAHSEGLLAISTKDYVDGLLGKERERLVDLVVGGVDEVAPSEQRGGRRIYEEVRDLKMKHKNTGSDPLMQYLPQATLTAGVKTGRYHQGHFNANQYNYLEGTVNVQGFKKPILLIGRQAMNRSVQGDVVVVEVFPENEWKAPGEEVVDQDLALRDDDAEDDEGAGVAEKEKEKDEQMDVDEISRLKKKDIMPTGRVVGIIKRNWRAYVCHLDRTSLSDAALTSLSQQTVFATPLSTTLPRIRLRTRQAPQLLDQKILVTIDSWSTNSRYPDGHFVRALGKVESKEAEQESLLLEYEVPYRPFGKAILGCLPIQGESWVVPPKGEGRTEWRDREDLRDLVVCSIDPPGCQDIDDALHARQLPNGNIEAGVHIADVSHFVLPDNPMDSEAASRGTTVYLVDKRIDMLPALLGTNLCSLRPFVERLAFSVIWEMDQDANIIKVRFVKSVIASKEAFTYEAAQNRKDDKSLSDPLTKAIRLLNSLAIKLKAGRMAAGALSLSSPELKIHLDSSESAEPIDVEQKQQRETNSLVEEFMLLANISVAAKIQEAFPQTAVLRRHPPPPKTNFETLQDILMKRKGLTLDVSSSKALAESLDACIDPTLPEFNTLVRIMATRCMLSAEYFCSGSVSKESFGHYGLATPIYTHFTSPIRRYADVLAHRQLSAAIGYTSLHPSLQSKSHVEKVLSVVNRRHRLAQMAGRASVEFYVGLALKARGGKSGTEGGRTREDAFVIRTFRNGLAVFVSSLGLEGLITFQKDTHEFDPENYVIKVPVAGEKGMKEIAVFDRVTVEVGIEQDKNTQRGKVKMIMVGPVDSEDL
ncbi:exosome complex exonuclease DIS3/RRP44, partial [Tremellales sp. Uapishka_1]